MLTATIARYLTCDEGTPGRFMVPGLLPFTEEGEVTGPVFEMYTLELPWRNNQVDISCIPAGEYLCEPVKSSFGTKATGGRAYAIQEVPGRGAIRMHSGNWAGSVKAQLRSDVKGCVLTGLALGCYRGQLAVKPGTSRRALGKFHKFMKWEPFRLKIINLWE